MSDKYILTAESVTEGHPDKLCDTIADSILDACLCGDPAARVACEVMATAGKIIVAGEITVKERPNIPAIVCRTVEQAGYGGGGVYKIEVITHDQSSDIAGAVSQGTQMGAGDQGIVYGYACHETAELLPLPVVLAHRLTRLLTNARKTGAIQGLGPDGKAQVSVEYRSGKPYRVSNVVVSCQHSRSKDLDELRSEVIRRVIVPGLRDLYPDHETEVLVNPSGRFVLGGTWGPHRSPAERVRWGEEEQGSERSFRRKAETEMSGLCDDEDTGLTGRKLMVDTYGGLAPHGGGALSGKDGTKVDRSGAYMARYIAKNIVAAGLAERCTVCLAYAIGRAEPVAVDIDAHQTSKYSDAALEQAVRAVFDLTPAGMISALGLDKPIFARFCNYGHFTHQDAPWERTDKTEALSDICVVNRPKKR